MGRVPIQQLHIDPRVGPTCRIALPKAGGLPTHHTPRRSGCWPTGSNLWRAPRACSGRLNIRAARRVQRPVRACTHGPGCHEGRVQLIFQPPLEPRNDNLNPKTDVEHVAVALIRRHFVVGTLVRDADAAWRLTARHRQKSVQEAHPRFPGRAGTGGGGAAVYLRPSKRLPRPKDGIPLGRGRGRQGGRRVGGAT